MKTRSLYVLALLPLAACDLFRSAYGSTEPILDPGAVLPPLPPGPAAEPPALLEGVDILEVVIVALAALGLGPVARVLALAKPLLTPILRAILGGKKAPPAPPAA
jgi:hypothetical protein